MQDVRLFIGEMEVEFKTVPDILYNWTETDLSNPTSTLNGYSKTITIEGTDNNNKIFGHLWNLERYQLSSSVNGPGFNPSYRVPFSLYTNGNMFEKGYVKLQNIKQTGGKTVYEIGLFGGLGSFLYNLSIDWNTGEQKSLADLQYYVNPDGLINNYNQDWEYYETSLDFKINKANVAQAWDPDSWPTTNYKWQILNFAPCYNGLNDKMSNDKAIMNFNGYRDITVNAPITPSSKTTDRIYRIKNGYSLATLPKQMTEWEVKDLRCWCQRPVISTKGILTALCSKKNNQGEFDSGYEVYIDPEWTKENEGFENPYFDQTWMTLPLLSSLEFNTTDEHTETLTANSWSSVYKTGQGNYTYVFTLPSAVTQYGVSAKLSFNLRVQCTTNKSALYCSYLYAKNFNPLNFKAESVLNAIGVQAYASDSANPGSAPLGGSEVYWLWEPVKDSYYPSGTPDWLKNKVKDYYSNPTYESCVSKGVYTPIVPDVSVISSEGYWSATNTTNLYQWTGKIELNCSLGPGATCIKINLQRCGTKNNSYSSSSSWIDTLVDNTFYTSAPTIYSSAFNTVAQTAFAGKLFELNYPGENNFYTNKKITQSQLLGTEYTPADWLMAYCKMYGLYIWKETDKDVIHIDTRNTFYRRNVVKDISSLIDYSKEVSINPIAIDAGYYEMKNESVQGAVFQDYLKKYGKEYGMKIINTGFQLDAETKQLIESPFQSAIQVRDNSQFYFKKWPTGEQPFFFGGMSYKMWTSGGQSVETYDWQIPPRVIATACTPYSTQYKFFDLFDKPQFCDAENKPLDGANVFLFKLANQPCADAGYMLTDDINLMAELNNAPCYIVAPSTADSSSFVLGLPVTQLPKYSRYLEYGSGLIVQSMDWGNPRELYVPELYIREDKTLYANYYKSYLEDLYDVNTKVLSCYIKPDKVITQDDLRNFYWFKNSLWRLNKVIDYNPVNNSLVKCEFIKVQDLEDISNIDVNDKSIFLSYSITPDNYPASGGVGTLEFTTNDGLGCTLADASPGVYISWSGSGKDGAYTVNVAENSSSESVIKTVRLTTGDEQISIDITQAAETQYFTVSPTSMSFDSGMSSASFTISSNTAWNVTEKPGWVEVATMSGFGTNYNMITVYGNFTSNDRYGDVVISSSTLGSSAITIMQASSLPQPWNGVISFTLTPFYIPQTGVWDDYTVLYSLDNSAEATWNEVGQIPWGRMFYSGDRVIPDANYDLCDGDVRLPFTAYTGNTLYVPQSFGGRYVYFKATFSSGSLGRTISSDPVAVYVSNSTLSVTIPTLA